MADDLHGRRTGVAVPAILGTVAVAAFLLWWVRRDRPATGMRPPNSSISGGWLVAFR